MTRWQTGFPPSFPAAPELLRVSSDGQIEAHLLSLAVGPPPADEAPDSPLPWTSVSSRNTPPVHLAPDGTLVALVRAYPEKPPGRSWRLLPVDPMGRIALDRDHRSPGSSVPVEVVVGTGHRVWLGFGGSSGDLTWVVLNPRGEPLGRTTLPAGARFLEAAQDHLRVSKPGQKGHADG